MMKSDDAMIVVVLLAAVASIAFILGRSDGMGSVRKQAIEHGYAEHNAKTGDWQWVEASDSTAEEE
jgi:hypothetical protein